jgi:hypothetical protein
MNGSMQKQAKFAGERRVCVPVQKEGPLAISPVRSEMCEDSGFTVPFAKSTTMRVLQLRWHVSAYMLLLSKSIYRNQVR